MRATAVGQVREFYQALTTGDSPRVIGLARGPQKKPVVAYWSLLEAKFVVEKVSKSS